VGEEGAKADPVPEPPPPCKLSSWDGYGGEVGLNVGEEGVKQGDVDPELSWNGYGGDVEL
jgi:hypothetical protein